jgi:hypothetical protein
MRFSKSRSRSKNNRNRSVGNVINRVFDSSGPEGKVRGTPQQIIDKYNQLTRDAQLSDDRVAAENFHQHSEHYTRMLNAAQREMDARREQQESEHRDRQQARHDNRPDQGSDMQHGRRPDTIAVADPSGAEQPDVVIDSTANSSGLVDTPETQPKRSAPRVRKSKPRPEASAPSGDRPDASEAAE